MALLADTSALYASIDGSDGQHQSANHGWTMIAARREVLLTSNYVVLETIALLHRRLGLTAVRRFQAEFVPVLAVHWVDEDLHERAINALLAVGRRDLSLVDCVSFEVMRRLGLDTAFAFDTHFAQQGFRPFPVIGG